MYLLKLIPLKFLLIGVIVLVVLGGAYQTFIGDQISSSPAASSTPLVSSTPYPSESPLPESSPTPAGSVKTTPKPSVKASSSPKASAASSAAPSPSTSPSPNPTNTGNSGVVLNSVDPSKPSFGTTMTLKGSGFGSTQGVYGVYYNGQAQPYGGIQSWSDTEIKTSSPFFVTGAEYQVEVQTADGRKSNRITVTAGDGQPSVESFSPSNAKPGQELVIKGGRFSYQGQVNFFQNYPNVSGSGQITSWTDTEIHLIIPTYLEAGKEYGIEVVSGGGGHSSFKYYSLGN